MVLLFRCSSSRSFGVPPGLFDQRPSSGALTASPLRFDLRPTERGACGEYHLGGECRGPQSRAGPSPHAWCRRKAAEKTQPSRSRCLRNCSHLSAPIQANMKLMMPNTKQLAHHSSICTILETVVLSLLETVGPTELRPTQATRPCWAVLVHVGWSKEEQNNRFQKNLV